MGDDRTLLSLSDDDIKRQTTDRAVSDVGAREALLCEGCSALAADEVRREKGRGYAFDNYTEYIIRHPDGEHLFVRLAQAAPPPETWVPPTPADLDALLIQWWPLQRDEYVAYIVAKVTEAAPPPELPLNNENGPWCGCGQPIGHVVPNVDCDQYQAAPPPRNHNHVRDGYHWQDCPGCDDVRDAQAAPPPDERPCGRYYGSDGTLCSTHGGRFDVGWQGPPHCDRLGREAAPPSGLDDQDYGWDVVRSPDYKEGYDAAVRRYVTETAPPPVHHHDYGAAIIPCSQDHGAAPPSGLDAKRANRAYLRASQVEDHYTQEFWTEFAREYAALRSPDTETAGEAG